MKQYISNIIPSSEIIKWKPGDRILITSQTGSGKSQWVKDQLYQYCKDNGKRILLLSNRSILRDQNKTEIETDNKQDIITLKNYQTLESSVNQGSDLNILFNNFDFIVYDEVHYIFSDSQFNVNTDILMSPLLHPVDNKIFIFITATPQAVKTYSSKYDYDYTIKTDYSYIETLYYYYKDETVENILHTIPDNEKAIYFGNAKHSLELSQDFNNAAFLCSEYGEYEKHSSRKVKNQIVENNRFDYQYLFSTKVLDNGINIIMPEVKHIFIAMIDPIDVVQCLGRKRIFDNDKINLYIKDVRGNQIVPLLRRMRGKLDFVKEQNELGPSAFLEKYARVPFDDIIMHNGQVNGAKLIYSKYMIDIFSKMFYDKDKKGFQNYINRVLLQDVSNVKDAELCYEQKSIETILQSYLGKRLYKNDIEQFKNIFFQNIFAPKRKIDIRKRGKACINSILGEDNLLYRIDSRTETGNRHRNETVWKVVPWDTEKDNDSG